MRMPDIFHLEIRGSAQIERMTAAAKDLEAAHADLCRELGIESTLTIEVDVEKIGDAIARSVRIVPSP